MNVIKLPRITTYITFFVTHLMCHLVMACNWIWEIHISVCQQNKLKDIS